MMKSQLLHVQGHRGEAGGRGGEPETGHHLLHSQQVGDSLSEMKHQVPEGFYLVNLASF